MSSGCGAKCLSRRTNAVHLFILFVSSACDIGMFSAAETNVLSSIIADEHGNNVLATVCSYAQAEDDVDREAGSVAEANAGCVLLARVFDCDCIHTRACIFTCMLF